jgi:hypothetical protein
LETITQLSLSNQFFFSLHILLIEKADLKKYGIILGLMWLLQLARFLYKFLKSKKAKGL